MTHTPADHLDPDYLPEFLCRACHPELNLTDEFKRAADARERAARDAARAALERERAIEKTTRSIERMAKHDPDPESVQGKILAGLRRKLERLEKEKEPWE